MEASRTKRSATRSRTFRTFATLDEREEKEICARIKEARKEAGFTQQQMADLLNVEKRTYQLYEATRVPFRRLEEIGKLTGRPREWLLYGDGPDFFNRLSRMEERIDAMSAQLDRFFEQMSATAVIEAVERAGEESRRSAAQQPQAPGAKAKRNQQGS